MKKEPQSPRKIRLLAIDLDDTLLMEDLTLSAENREALLAASKAGVSVVLASGRVIESMQKYVEELGFHEKNEYVISGNGTRLLKSDTGEELYKLTIPIEESIEAFRYINSFGYPVTAYDEGVICFSRKGKWVLEDSRLSGFPVRYIDDFPAFIRERNPLKLLVQTDPENVNRLLPDLRERFGDSFNILTSKPFFLELLPKGGDKGHALEFLANKLEIPQEQVMAIGDSHNDLGMIRYAGIGVAVANAGDEIKLAADVVLKETHEEHAVKMVVETYILNQKIL